MFATRKIVAQKIPRVDRAVLALAQMRLSERPSSFLARQVVVVYNWRCGTAVQRFVGHEREVSKVTFPPDG